MQVLARALAASLIVAGATVAHADRAPSPAEVPAKARVLADLGRAYHDAGQYPEAIAAFEQAYALAPSPGLLFDLAQAYRLAGDCNDAAWMYRRYLASDPAPDRRAAAEEHLAHVSSCERTGRPVVAPSMVASLAPGLARSTPSRGAAHPVSAVVAAPIAPAPSRARQAALWVGIGGGAVLVGAAYFAIDAHAAANQVSSIYADGGAAGDVATIDARGRRSATIAAVLGAGGGLALVGAATLYVLGGRAAAHHVVIAPHAGGAEVRAAWRF